MREGRGREGCKAEIEGSELSILMLGFSQSQVIAKKHLSGGKLGVKIEEKSWAWA